MKKVLGNIDMKLEEVDGIWTWKESSSDNGGMTKKDFRWVVLLRGMVLDLLFS